MKEELFVSLDRSTRIVYDNFWYRVEYKDGLGRFRSMGSCRSLEGAIVGFNFWSGYSNETFQEERGNVNVHAGPHGGQCFYLKKEAH